MSFHEVRFPDGISYGTSGGPERRTEIAMLGSGFEERNSPWAHSRRRYNAGYGVRDTNDLHTVIGFFEARHGRLHGFRFKDWLDWKSCPPLVEFTPTDQSIGIGDGVQSDYQLVKRYQSGGQTYTRPINKPVAGTVRIALDGVEQTTGWSVDTTNGLITFEVPPASGAVVTAGFEFDVPVRFDTDRLDIALSRFRAGDIPSIPLIELKLKS
ncbi:MAG TPA: TIGR02217 family protein [Rhizobiales bacterium]|nr:TIGR02217 family protein [Hyphomicrobiales bacterium]